MALNRPWRCGEAGRGAWLNNSANRRNNRRARCYWVGRRLHEGKRGRNARVHSLDGGRCRYAVDQLFTLAEKLSRSADPVEGLQKWLKANLRLVATKKGMVEALQLVAHGSSEELLRALVGKLSFSIGGKWQPGALRLINVFVDGLCRSTSLELRAANKNRACWQGKPEAEQFELWSSNLLLEIGNIFEICGGQIRPEILNLSVPYFDIGEYGVVASCRFRNCISAAIHDNYAGLRRRLSHTFVS